MPQHRLLPAVVGIALLAGCGSAPEPVGPTGVDELQIPTPSPAPSDFVTEVTNPWLAWSPGATWTYATTDDRDRPATYTVTIRDRATSIAGVEATTADAELVLDATGEQLAGETTYAAQDRDGNVWLLGREETGDTQGRGDAEGAGGPDVEWRAGEDGARAGLLMPATPRLGDGFVAHEVPGQAAARRSVLDLAAPAPAQVEGSGPTLLLQLWTSSEPDGVAREYYRRDTGLVARTFDPGQGNDLMLREHSAPVG